MYIHERSNWPNFSWDHGTVTVLVHRPGGAVKGHREHVEVTTFRGEGAYSDGRRNHHVRHVGIESVVPRLVDTRGDRALVEHVVPRNERLARALGRGSGRRQRRKRYAAVRPAPARVERGGAAGF